MLVTFLIWAYSFAIFYFYGRGMLILFKRVFHLQDEISAIPFPVTVTLGIAVITTLASLLSLLMPLGGFAAAIILIGGFVIAIWTRPFHDFRLPSYHFLIWILFILMGLALLENATHAPNNPDTALYHAQAIRWIETYRLVPGLANLHDRLGFNSSWLVLNAAFSFSFLGIQSFHLASSFITLAVTIYFLEGPRNLLQEGFSKSGLIKTLFIAFPFYFYNSEMSSPSADLPAFLLILVVVALWVEKHEKSADKFNLESVVLSSFSVFALTVKLSALPIALAAAWIVARGFFRKDYGRAFALGLTDLVILTPWLVRNVALSGYLVFPLYQIDLFPVDWKYPKESAETLARTISTFARFPVKNWRQFSGLSFREWFPIWFENLTRNQQLIFLLAALSPFSLLFGKLFRVDRNTLKAYSPIALICWIGVVYWLLAAPDIRFGYGYLLSAVMLAASIVLTILLTRISKLSSIIAALLFSSLIFYQGCSLITSLDTASLVQRVRLPADYLPSHADPCPLRSGTVFCRREGFQCNYGNFPCIPSPRPNVEMRGSSLQDGFRYAP